MIDENSIIHIKDKWYRQVYLFILYWTGILYIVHHIKRLKYINWYRCVLCNKRYGKLNKIVYSTDIYGSSYYRRYHEGCLCNVTENPREHTNLQVDMTLEIHESLKKEHKSNLKSLERFEKRCSKLEGLWRE